MVQMEVWLMGPLGYTVAGWDTTKIYTWISLADGWDVEDGGGMLWARWEKGRMVYGCGEMWRVEWKA